uniref:Uncharacterized protein n=1 Tax=Timema cristinae TaxID=61476 RepID=A0A7R9HD82_TIMCR|nr:unnamed protein product [Timema cristinae]
MSLQTRGNTYGGGGAKLFQEEERDMHTSETRGHHQRCSKYVETLGKIRNKQPRPGVSVETIDVFTRDSVRQVIFTMYHEGKHVSIDSIWLAIRTAEIVFHGGKSTL